MRIIFFDAQEKHPIYAGYRETYLYSTVVTCSISVCLKIASLLVSKQLIHHAARDESTPPTHTHKDTLTRKKFYGHMDVSQQLTCDRRGIRSCVHWIKNAVGSLWSCCCIFCLPPSPQVIGNHYHYYCTNHSVQSTYHSWRVSHDMISTTITSRVIMFLVQLEPPAHDPGLHILDTHISLLCIIRICIMSLFIFLWCIAVRSICFPLDIFCEK